MSACTKWFPALGFISSALAVGVPYFLIPYRELTLPSALYGPGLGILVAATALTRICGATFWQGTAIVGASIPFIILVRVAWDTATDPTSHNLWPFEILIGSGVGALCASTGFLVGWIIAKLSGRGTDKI